MKQGNLRQIVSEKIAGKSLDHHQLAALLKHQPPKPAAKRFTLKQLPALLATLLICLLVAQSLLTTKLSIEEKIGSEVAKNHIKLKPLEIKTSQFEQLQHYFTELDFTPVLSRHINLNRQALIGGRYCSIQGITAAQLRLKDTTTGQLQSLYQTHYDKNVFSGIAGLTEGQQPVTVHVKGLTVDIWVEKGLLFALTKN
ncbi:MAG: hypothetical protein OEY11_14030 [Gammaproteobacteria bacterium]|nr:hypothetical protein [Gammaproteobacteria bacterium]